MADSKDHLKSVVEQSLAILNQNKDAARTDASRRRSLPVYVNAANLQKVAVVSASNALASLWKISAPGRAERPPRKVFLQLKLTNGA
jgi:hypothetical protein